MNEIHLGEQRDSGAKLFKKTTWWPSRLEPEPYKLKVQGITSWPGYLMIQGRLQHLFQIVRWDYWDTNGWRKLITIWYSTNCKAVMREKPCQIFSPFSRLRPYHRENTSSHLITEVKPCRAGLVLGWVTAWEYPCCRLLLFVYFSWNFFIIFAVLPLAKAL